MTPNQQNEDNRQAVITLATCYVNEVYFNGVHNNVVAHGYFTDLAKAIKTMNDIRRQK